MEEPKEVLSRTEEAFERWRKTTGLFLGPVVFFILYLLPVPSLSPQAHKLLSVLGLVIVYWIFEAIPIPVTALLGAVLSVLLNIAPAEEVLAPFAHPLVFLFIGSFILAEAISLHSLDRRFSFAILSLKFLENSPVRVLFAFGFISAAISMWISNTAAAAMMLPVALGVLRTIKGIGENSGARHLRYDSYSSAMMLMIAYGASIGGIATPIGSPPNLIAIGMIDTLAGVKITFFEWMLFAVPITLVMLFYLCFLLGRFGGGLEAKLAGVGEYVRRERALIGRWKRGEINTAVSFSVAVFLWVFPSIVSLLLGPSHEFSKLIDRMLDGGIVALFAAALLFILPVSFKDRVFTLTWERAANIDWGTIILFGGGLSLGKLMFSTGLATEFGRALTSLTGATSLWSITAMGALFALILSETTSNTTSANMAIPVVIAIAKAAGVEAVVPALGASFGFMLPVSTPPTAIVYGSGMVPILTMLKKGILFDIGGLIIIIIGLMALMPLFGWM